jgi:hypothetical protein
MAARFNLNPIGWAIELIKDSKDSEELVENPTSLPGSQRSLHSSSTTDEY